MVCGQLPTLQARNDFMALAQQWLITLKHETRKVDSFHESKVHFCDEQMMKRSQGLKPPVTNKRSSSALRAATVLQDGWNSTGGPARSCQQELAATSAHQHIF